LIDSKRLYTKRKALDVILKKNFGSGSRQARDEPFDPEPFGRVDAAPAIALLASCREFAAPLTNFCLRSWGL
jgi:hypothetical protein